MFHYKHVPMGEVKVKIIGKYSSAKDVLHAPKKKHSLKKNKRKVQPSGAIPDKKSVQKVAKKVVVLVQKSDVLAPCPYPQYPQAVQQLYQRVVLLKNCYEGKELSHRHVEKAVLNAKLFDTKRVVKRTLVGGVVQKKAETRQIKKLSVINRYFKILSFVGLDAEDSLLIERLHEYHIQHPPVPKKVVSSSSSVPSSQNSSLVATHEVHAKKSKRRKRNGYKKKKKRTCKWKKNPAAMLFTSVEAKSCDVKHDSPPMSAIRLTKFETELYVFLTEQGVPTNHLPRLMGISKAQIIPLIDGYNKKDWTETFYLCICNSGHEVSCAQLDWMFSGWSIRVQGKEVIFFKGDWKFNLSSIPISKDILFIVSRRTKISECAQFRPDLICISQNKKKLVRKVKSPETKRK